MFWKTVRQYLGKLTTCLSDPTIAVLGIYPTKISAYFYQKRFMEALFSHQNLEMTQMPINAMDKQAVIYSKNGVLYDNKKKISYCYTQEHR